jgi:hypothetical protein
VRLSEFVSVSHFIQGSYRSEILNEALRPTEFGAMSAHQSDR